jgi:hypothetical protein
MSKSIQRRHALQDPAHDLATVLSIAQQRADTELRDIEVYQYLKTGEYTTRCAGNDLGDPWVLYAVISSTKGGGA